MTPFRFTIPVRTLRDAVTRLRAVVPRKSTLPVLSCILLCRHEGTTRIVGNDLDVALTRFLPSSVPIPGSDLGRQLLAQRFAREDGSIAVPLATLSTVARAADLESVIAVTEKGLTYKLGGKEINCKDYVPGIEFPMPSATDAPEFPLSGAAQAAILDARFCASTDETRFTLNGVHLTRTAIVATDGRQLFRTETSVPINDPDGAIIPNKPLDVLAKHFAKEPWLFSLAATRAVATFRMGDWTLSTKLIDGNYPNWKQVLIPDSKEQEVIQIEPIRTEILSVLERLPVGKENSNPPDQVQLNLSGKIINFSAGDPQMVVTSTTTKKHQQRHVNGCRKFWKRAVSHGFTELRILDEFHAVVATKPTTLYMFMPCKDVGFQSAA